MVWLRMKEHILAKSSHQEWVLSCELSTISTLSIWGDESFSPVGDFWACVTVSTTKGVGRFSYMTVVAVQSLKCDLIIISCNLMLSRSVFVTIQLFQISTSPCLSTLTSSSCSIPKSCPICCNPMDFSTPGFPVLHCFPEFAQIHAHWVSDDIQPSHPLSSPSPPVLILSQPQSLSSEWVLWPAQLVGIKSGWCTVWGKKKPRDRIKVLKMGLGDSRPLGSRTLFLGATSLLFSVLASRKYLLCYDEVSLQCPWSHLPFYWLLKVSLLFSCTRAIT